MGIRWPVEPRRWVALPHDETAFGEQVPHLDQHRELGSDRGDVGRSDKHLLHVRPPLAAWRARVRVEQSSEVFHAHSVRYVVAVIVVRCAGGPWDGQERNFRASPVAGSELSLIEYTDDPGEGHYRVDLDTSSDGSHAIPLARWINRVS
jgi:hypothetical protein